MDLTSLTRSFSNFGIASLPSIPEGFVDASWHNDMCPSFVNEAANLRLWVDYENPADREDPSLPRFMLCTAEIDTLDDSFEIISTNNFGEVLTAIAGHTK